MPNMFGGDQYDPTYAPHMNKEAGKTADSYAKQEDSSKSPHQELALKFKAEVDALILQAQAAKSAGLAAGFRIGSMVNERRALRLQDLIKDLEIMRNGMDKYEL
jgi:hypothetical protein